MKKTLLAFILAVFPSSAWAQITSVSQGFALSANNNSVGLTISTTGATLIVVVIADNEDLTPCTFTDTPSNTYTLRQTKLTARPGGSGPRVRILDTVSATPSTNGSHAFNCSGATNTYPAVAVRTFSGTTGSQHDQMSSNNSTTDVTSLAAGTVAVTPTAAGSVLVTGVGAYVYDPDSIDSSFILGGIHGMTTSSYSIGIAYLIQGAATSVNPVWGMSSADVLATVIDTWKPTSAGPTGPKKGTLTLVGVGR